MSNEIIRTKKKIHALVSNYENLVVTVGGIFIVIYLIISLALALIPSPFTFAFLGGVFITWLGMRFLLKEYEVETGERTGWLHEDII